jgi:hypothetical protein
VQYTKIDRCGEHRVMDPHIILIHRILESSKVLIVVLEKISEK